MNKARLTFFLHHLITPLAIMFLLINGGCTNRSYNGKAVNQPFSISPVFQDFYQQVNGEEIFGGIISPQIPEGNYIYQYTVNVLLIKDLQKEGDQSIRFYPIGKEFNLPPYVMKNRSQEGEIYKDGIAIYRDFFPFYEKLGRELRLGKPLTGLRYNPLQKRYEQLFEGAGMYFLASDEQVKVKFLAYGSWKCGSTCVYPVPREAEVIPPKPIDPRIMPFVEKIGLDFTGFALSEAYILDGNKLQQIFENVVVEVDLDQPGQIYLVDVPQRLGILPEAPVAQNKGNDVLFVPVAGDKGHNILPGFVNYLKQYGGMDVLGAPISEAKNWGEGTIRQCFQFVCLEEDPRIGGIYRVRPSPLGVDYLYINKPQYEPTSAGDITAEIVREGEEQTTPSSEVILELWEAHPWVDKFTPQQLGVTVQINHQLREGLAPYLMVVQPDGETIRLEMPATDKRGRSVTEVPAIEAPNGTLIYYQICIQLDNGKEYCAQDDYTIWAQP